MNAALKLQVEAGIRDAVSSVDPGWPDGAIEQLIRGVHLFMEAAAQEEREACATVAEEYRPARKNAFDFEDASSAAKTIASLIRGRGER